MEIILVSITNSENGGMFYTGTPDTIKVDEALSGCKVWFLGDTEVSCENFVPYQDFSFSGRELLNSTTPEIRHKWATMSLLRLLSVWDFVNSRSDVSWPILPLDNDIMVFSDLNEAYKPFMNYDFVAPVYGGIQTTGAYSVHNKECLEESIKMLWDLVKVEPVLNDMYVWSKMFQSGSWKVGNLLDKVEEGTFDTNMHLSEGRYVMEPSSVLSWGPETKKIIWIDERPYFVEADTNEPVKAHWIHCWGSYKFRTKELLQKASL